MIQANPANAPFIRFVNLNFFSFQYPNITHINAEDEALICVFNTAIAAYSLHYAALPPLKLNHPAQTKVAPITFLIIKFSLKLFTC